MSRMLEEARVRRHESTMSAEARALGAQRLRGEIGAFLQEERQS